MVSHPFSLYGCYCQIYRKIWWFDLSFNGVDEYVGYGRPDGKLWTSLYRFSMKYKVPESLDSPKSKDSGKSNRLDDVLYFMYDLDQDCQLEISRSGYIFPCIYNYYWRQSRKIPVRQIRNFY